MRDQRSNIPEIGDFSNLQVHISKTINCIETKTSPSCCTFNSEQNDVLFWYLNQTFVSIATLEGNNVNHTGKITQGQTWQKTLIDI